MSERRAESSERAFDALMICRPLLALALVFLLGAAQFQPALPGYEFQFPRDHGSHDEYRTEWWYYTGHLRTERGHRYGFELTFFRVGVVPPDGTTATNWDLRNVALAHFAITDVDGRKFRYYEKFNRESQFTAQSAAGALDVFNEGWSARTMPDGSWHLTAAASNDSIDLLLRARKPPAIHGENGVSVKAEGVGHASHYYSMTHLEVSGAIDGQRCTGSVWMDHEFGSSNLRENQQGWDWFAVQLDNDTELMLYQIRRTDGTPDISSSGSLITSDGSVIHIARGQMQITPTASWKSGVTGATYPMGWRIALPAFHVALVVKPLLRNQELVTKSSTRVTYWEGAVDVAGSFDNVSVSGTGYVEMTGYDKRFAPP